MITEQYDITGMSCAACSSAVERVTRKLESVTESSVNLTTALLTITYDEHVLTRDAIIQKVEKAGFGAALHLEQTKQEKEKSEEHLDQEVKKTRQHLITNIIFAVPLLYISMGHMVPFPMPLPAFLDMHESPLNFAWHSSC